MGFNSGFKGLKITKHQQMCMSRNKCTKKKNFTDYDRKLRVYFIYLEYLILCDSVIAYKPHFLFIY